ncbi:hypothetical protein [Streptomyces sp. NPDC003247]|uniref:hypothetical protein n=1 Tax=Streptomyces sp. NPDC003247 TaxID=3364677 RepID=UPI003692A0CF
MPRCCEPPRRLDAAVEQLRALPSDQREHRALDKVVTWASPLKHANLNVPGRYSFRTSGPVGGVLRPLHDPAEVEDEDDAEE